jgi:hypothetical protein
LMPLLLFSILIWHIARLFSAIASHYASCHRLKTWQQYLPATLAENSAIAITPWAFAASRPALSLIPLLIRYFRHYYAITADISPLHIISLIYFRLHYITPAFHWLAIDISFSPLRHFFDISITFH